MEIKETTKVAVVVTSFNRPDLLLKTVESFNQFNTYPIDDFIIIEDSRDKKMHDFLVQNFFNYHLIINKTNIGLIDSIDKAYSQVSAPFTFHSEDDYEYYRSGFIEKSLKILESDLMIMQVWIRGLNYVTGINIESEVLKAGDVEYHLVGSCKDNFWHGFCFQCGLRKMSAYERIKPFTQWSLQDEFITSRECKIGEAYHKLGYRAAILTEGYARHTGYKRSTFGLLNI